MSLGDGEEDNTYYLQEVDLDEDEDNIEYDEVPETFDDSDDDDIQDDFGAVLKNLKEGATELPAKKRANPVKTLGSKPTVVDDFIRNFLIKLGMSKTLDTFNTEWYKMDAEGALNTEDISAVADVYQRNEDLDEQVKLLRKEVDKAKAVADKARGTWDKFRKERDFHRMHHRRVVQEKNLLIRDMKRLKKHYSSFEPALKAMRVKYETAMKDKMLMRLERDRLQTKIEGLEETLRAFESLKAEESGAPAAAPLLKSKTKKPVNEGVFEKKKKGDSILPPDDRINPHLNRDYEPLPANKFTLRKTFRGHQMAISGMALHPTKQIVATVSDDQTWKMWSVQRGELIMSGDGHKDWIAACDFHPRGHMLATASGDKTVKLWNFVEASCAVTFAEHTQAVWDVAFHDSGDFFVSGSMDHNARLFDIESQRCRQTFRGHVDSVNAVNFQPYSNNVVTASGDKTVSLWDVRSGLCIQTFYGHENAVLSAAFNYQGDSIASSDSDGVIRMWDVRMVGQLMEIVTADTGKQGQPINDVKFDISGNVLIAGSDAGVVKMYDVGETAAHIGDLTGPEGAVQSVVVDPAGNFIMAASSDQTFRLFSS